VEAALVSQLGLPTATSDIARIAKNAKSAKTAPLH